MSLFEVWSPATLAAATLGGLGAGYWIIGRIAADPAYAAGTLTAGQLGRLVAASAIATGSLFYVVQAFAALIQADPDWPLVVSRYSLWIVYTLALGLGAGRSLHDYIQCKHRAAFDKARQELSGGAPA